MDQAAQRSYTLLLRTMAWGQLEMEYLCTKDHDLGLMGLSEMNASLLMTMAWGDGLLEIEYFTTMDYGP